MVHIYSSCPSSSAHCVCSSMAATLLPSCPWLHVAHTSKVLPVTRSPPLLFPIITCGNKLIANRKGMWAQLLPTRSGHMLEHRVGSTYFSMQNFYPTCKATPSCLCVCVSVCVCVSAKKILKMLQAGSLRCLQTSQSTNNDQHDQIRTFLNMIQVQAVLYAVISATSYYQFHGSSSFEIACGISTRPCYGQQLKYTKMQAYGRVNLVTTKRHMR